MILKLMTGNAGGDYGKSLRQRSWAALAILAIGLVGPRQQTGACFEKQ